jgi:hypothetical protein
MRILPFFILCLASLAFADDFKTIEGKEYKNATVKRVEPDGLVLSSKSGISKVYFNELPKEVQERFHYDAAKGQTYSAEQNANLEALRKQQEEALRQKAEVTDKNNKYAGEQLSALDAAKHQRALQARYNELQQQEADLLQQIGQAKQPGARMYSGRGYPSRYRYDNPLASQLPSLEGRLDDVRHEKDQIRKQLEQG